MSRRPPASRGPLVLLSAALCLIVLGCSGLAAGAGRPSQEGERVAPAVVRSHSAEPTSPTVTPGPTAAPTEAPIGLSELVGEDGRLTVLILGSDRRDGIAGERTDAIIVAGIDPGSGKVTLVSLPRDTVEVPIAPGETYPGRVNSLFLDQLQSAGKRKAALSELRDALAYAFDTEIDYYALVDFDGLVRLIDGIDGIEVTLDEPLVDPTMHLGERGLRLRTGRHRLNGKEALAFSRSRHADSDYGRSRRQQQVLVAAAAQVRERGLASLPALVELVRKKAVTDLPLRAAPALLELAMTADLAEPRSFVLEPGRWARQVPGSYIIAPRVVEIQKLFDRLASAGSSGQSTGFP